MNALLAAFWLLVIYQFKHFFADYVLQGTYMAGKFKEKGWVLPLAAHCGVHAAYTFTISAVYLAAILQQAPGRALAASVGLAILDFSIHFGMDRLKASKGLLGRFEPLDKSGFLNIQTILKYPTMNEVNLGTIEAAVLKRHAKARLRENDHFWWVLGFDQMVHHLTHYAIISYLVTQ